MGKALGEETDYQGTDQSAGYQVKPKVKQQSAKCVAGDAADATGPGHSSRDVEQQRITTRRERREQCILRHADGKCRRVHGHTDTREACGGKHAERDRQNHQGGKAKPAQTYRNVIAHHIQDAVDKRHAGHQDHRGRNERKRWRAAGADRDDAAAHDAAQQRDDKCRQDRIDMTAAKLQPHPGADHARQSGCEAGKPISAEQAAQTCCGNTEAHDNEPSWIDRGLMLDRVERRPDVVKAKALTAGVIDQAVYRLDRRHSNTNPRQPVADLRADMIARDQSDQHRLVAHQQVRFDAEGRRESRHRSLHLFGVRAVQQQEAAKLQGEMRKGVQPRSILLEGAVIRPPCCLLHRSALSASVGHVRMHHLRRIDDTVEVGFGDIGKVERGFLQCQVLVHCMVGDA